MVKLNEWGIEEKYWEDFPLGGKMRTTEVTVTEAHLVNWGCLTGDWYPLHFNEEYAKTTVFKGRIAHGPLTLALAIGLVGMTGYLGTSVIAWLGVGNMRLPAPVRIGDTIHVETEVIDKKETKKAEQGVTTIRYTIKNQRDEEVMIAEQNLMMHHRK